ncbi:KilA-N domain-containing protein [Acinetobacter baumannii]|uniref:KilA-N domain-containing protein n=1 Tax=Acinetobacter calcoaceticus/baumannii complex TaxID=909768 RepID=UPI0007085295|nr:MULTISPECIES: KilA-N domain-containing protein [Acinetobacter calcoaceticus/baumannii complex]KQD96459.1 DNA-binding protein [Acinetobacter baumannii]KQD99576.1 DNA-binding protein [Acinetobacter baumannii]MBF1851353.1 KilA-N domain-containing protein [Acinetobacter baumannii]MBV6575964.1 KilA-N domain-containing protein [Acinetobacter baumannii]MCF1281511.1 KilA-N domain-containing protein [Acinetobacter pittii]
MQYSLELITHNVDNNIIHQRSSDGYVNATALCRAVGKQFNDYSRTKTTQAFLAALSRSTKIPVDLLVITISDGDNYRRGTWVHPQVAINLGQWCSPEFAVAVAQFVNAWATGTLTQKNKMPYHLERYVQNMNEIPHTHFSMLNELTFNLIAPMENRGYTLPENMVPDISEGKMFSKWLRDVKGIDTSALPSYSHRYQDGRIVQARLYPIELLPDFRKHFHEVWIPQKALTYFRERDPQALPYLTQVYALTYN